MLLDHVGSQSDSILPLASPSISIAMATYNGEKFIGEQLESLAAQSAMPLELVVTDDGSSDGTVDIVNQFRTSAPFPVKFLKNERRLGYGENFLQATMQCRGDVILFCDQDDVWLPEKVATLVSWVERSDCLLFMHSADVIDEFGHLAGWRLPDYRIDHELAPVAFPFWDFAFTGCTMAVTRKLFEISRKLDHTDNVVRDMGLGHGDIHFSHDKWFYLLAASIGKIAVSNRSLIQYRRHSSNTTLQHKKVASTFEERVGRLARGNRNVDLQSDTEKLSKICLSRARFFASNYSILTQDERQNAEYVVHQYERMGRFYAAKANMLCQTQIVKRVSPFLSALTKLIGCSGPHIAKFRLKSFLGLAKALISR